MADNLGQVLAAFDIVEIDGITFAGDNLVRILVLVLFLLFLNRRNNPAFEFCGCNANIIQAQLLFLASTDNTSDISLYLNTPGGVVSSGLGIYDTMQIIEPDVATICTGMAASMGSVLLCAGAQGKRSALKHARVMIHQPLGGAQGQASDILIAAQEIEKIKKELYSIISEHSGQPIERIYADGDRDFWLNSQEALEYGMIDEILTKRSK